MILKFYFLPSLVRGGRATGLGVKTTPFRTSSPLRRAGGCVRQWLSFTEQTPVFGAFLEKATQRSCREENRKIGRSRAESHGLRKRTGGLAPPCEWILSCYPDGQEPHRPRHSSVCSTLNAPQSYSSPVPPEAMLVSSVAIPTRKSPSKIAPAPSWHNSRLCPSSKIKVTLCTVEPLLGYVGAIVSLVLILSR